MVDETTPIPSGAGATLTEPEPTAPRRRKLWPFIAAGVVLLLALAAVIIALVVVNTGPAPRTPTQAVSDFDTSFETANCELFQETTTREFQDSFFGAAFECGPWEDNAASLQVDGRYAYDLVINDEVIAEDEQTADVTTTETDTAAATPTTYELVYHLVRSGSSWVIDGIEATS